MENINKSLFLFSELPNEIWSYIPNIRKKYIVSSCGRVASLIKGNYKIMSASSVGRGYLNVTLSNNGIVKSYSIHRLVAITFIENPNCYPQVNHKDENKKNNNVDNLEWCTAKYNLEYSGITTKWRKTTLNITPILRKLNPLQPIKDRIVRKKLYRFKLKYRNSKIYCKTKEGEVFSCLGFEDLSKQLNVNILHAIQVCFTIITSTHWSMMLMDIYFLYLWIKCKTDCSKNQRPMNDFFSIVAFVSMGLFLAFFSSLCI